MTGRAWSVTGHRPDKCGGYDAATFGYLVAAARLCLMWAQPQKVLTGFALGWDIAVAAACQEMGIPYQPCIPFEGQECKWRIEQQNLYHRLLQLATLPPVYVSEPPYAAFKMEVRNQYMVNNSENVLALYNGDGKGGTFNCVKYAQKTHKNIFNAWGRLSDLKMGQLDIRVYQSVHYPVVR